MKYVSLFAGIGGFDLALNRLGHVCVWANEWDKYAAQIYNSNFVNSKTQNNNERVELFSTRSNGERWREYSNGIDTRDIRTIPTSEIPDHDLLVGGFPCQAFSIAGKRKGFDDTRGTLFFEIARILTDKRPRYFILENVKGLLSHDGGKTFSTILGVLTDIGYDYEWQVLNSKNFGVPQNRERVFIVGYLRGQPRPEIFPIGVRNEQNEIKRLGYMQGFRRYNQTYDPSGIVEALDTSGGGGHQPCVPMRWVRTEKGKEYRREAQKRGRDLTPFNEGYRELVESRGDAVGCITNALQKDALLKQGMRIRRLTPIECERLQGFPDGWTEKGINEKGEEVAISDTQRYKVLGNAVSVPVIREIVLRLNNNTKKRSKI
jgi:DNA (cytosine-5)-methyltransferase 1